MNSKRYLFVCGAPRSGTSYLHAILASHPGIALGLERYSLLLFKETLSPADFAGDRLLRMQPGDTWYDSLDMFPWQRDVMRDHHANATYVGDKVPRAYEHYGHLASHFDDVRIVCIFRNVFDVAASYEARRRAGTHWRPDCDARRAVLDWNRCLTETLAWIDRVPILPVIYEELTSSETTLDRIARFLELDAAPFHEAWHTLARETASEPGSGAARLEPDALEFIVAHADEALYDRMAAIARR